MKPIITAFERSPDGGKGLARDTRVRWALEEVGQPYDVRPISFKAMKELAHRARHPFGQIPTYEDGDLVLFESGAIVLHIAETHVGLLPEDANGRARAIMWMFSALSTIEPPVLELANAALLERDEPWSKARLPLVRDRVRVRLRDLSSYLGDADWLDGGFSAGDLMMVHALLRLRSSGLLDEFPNLSPYIARARPGLPTGVHSPPNWRPTPERRQPHQTGSDPPVAACCRSGSDRYCWQDPSKKDLVSRHGFVVLFQFCQQCNEEFTLDIAQWRKCELLRP